MGRNKYTTPPLRMGRKSNTEILVVRSGYWLYVAKQIFATLSILQSKISVRWLILVAHPIAIHLHKRYIICKLVHWSDRNISLKQVVWAFETS
jgi:hypothetical protein